jgi:HD-GYP domain-containing protein (c-di-GMP phosphodiesterase class II)
MTTTRPYREAMAQTVAIAELVKNAGRQFDPRVIDALIAATGAGALSTADGWSS